MDGAFRVTYKLNGCLRCYLFINGIHLVQIRIVNEWKCMRLVVSHSGILYTMGMRLPTGALKMDSIASAVAFVCITKQYISGADTREHVTTQA